MTKVLVIRLSSIGDIVLTSPVIRCLKEQLNDVEIHALTKPQYVSLYASNPMVEKVHAWGDNQSHVLSTLKAASFDYVIDLHRNIRTQQIKTALRQKHFTFPKLNVQKWLYVNLKYNRMPDVHIVDRYFEAVAPLGVKNDLKGLDFFINEADKNAVQQLTSGEDYFCLAIGAQFSTKKLPVAKWAEIVDGLDRPVIIIGGREDIKEGEALCRALPEKKIYNTCGELSIEGSAAVVQQSRVLVTHDTGMMHIGAALRTPVVSIWGNTVPEFGMYPYRPMHPASYTVHEVKGLSCRPCSKIGYSKCPKKHFNCMMQQDVVGILKAIKSFDAEDQPAS